MNGPSPTATAQRGARWRPARLAAAFVALAVATTAAPLPGAEAVTAGAEPPVSVIVRETPDAGDRPERLVERLGGDLGRTLDIIDGFVADVPADAVDDLAASPAVVSVTPNAAVEMQHAGDYDHDGEHDDVDDDDGIANHTSELAEEILAHWAWEYGVTGEGVDVAIVDTGVSRTRGLDAPGKVIYGPDLSFDGGTDREHADLYGHGTHLAGIIAGRDAGLNVHGNGDGTLVPLPDDAVVGVAPDARLVSVKVGDSEGVTDVSQVIAAIDWIVQHRNANGMNIRVLNLSFGTDSVQDYKLDPLTYAVEVAWRKGIVVVTAAGNSGHQSGRLTNPAYDPFVIAVGATDHRGTPSPSDDVIPDFSSRGDGVRNPDLAAPGKSVVSVIPPNSKGFKNNPHARVGNDKIKGSGTSQSAAVISGAAALILDRFPNATPDQVKAGLKKFADKLPSADPRAQGAGAVNVLKPLYYGLPSQLASAQPHVPATGLGSLEASRGSAHVQDANGVVLEGEVTVLGSRWSGSTWSGSTWSGSTWSGSTWSGSRWSTGDWLGSTWSGSTWSSVGLLGSTWSGSTWSGSTWSGSTWSGSTWSSAGWLGVTWE